MPIQLERMYTYGDSDLSKEIFKNNPDWTINNFGPIFLPKEKYFFQIKLELFVQIQDVQIL